MMTLGGVWYPDHDKSWSLSVLNHFEFNSQVPGVRSTSFGGHIVTFTENIPCSVYSLEWGISKTVCDETDLGIAGYYQRQFTDHDGATTPLNDSSVAGIGPEIRTLISRWGLSGSLRYAYEFSAYHRP